MFKKKNEMKESDFEIAIVYGDLHIPYHDQNLTRILLNVIEDLQPAQIVDIGDIVNADQISAHPKEYSQLQGLQSELNQVHVWLEAVQTIAPKAKKLLLTDNHFFKRISTKIAKENYGLADLESLKPEALLKLKEFGWTSAPEWNWKNVLLAQHGDDCSGSSASPTNTVRRLVLQNSISVIRGHSHGHGQEVYRNYGDKYLMGLQLGSFHDFDKVGYIKHNALTNWVHSFAIIYLSKKTDEFHVQPVYFVNNRCIINGKVYQ